MDFLYFPEDKSEYIPGIISVIVIFILSMLIIWLLIRASKKQVQHLEDQGYSVNYDMKNSDDPLSIDDKPEQDEVEHTSENDNGKKGS
ncbi:hypothetical protein [Planococcus halotolerans]|uniref:Uncharacterized protein n=1 Tax=Planococcus halotolerans TaxID=2233542 RepID=A0A365KQG6_9BACL|nr:hypothetical protein [Planococcus halotolerans]QHJ69448.1 hypothetical protein DNR44_001845 [Planococcus halotolerans]RAZ75400.1 hypothetical protein DP120_13555 [Planococcus halotolerans]